MNIKTIISGILETIKTLAIVIILAFLIKTFLIQTFIVDGQSMEPNYHNGEYLLVDKFGIKIKPPKRGDVVVFLPPNDPTKNYIKRVIAIPGEKIEIVNNRILINNRMIDEGYLKENEKTYIGSSLLADYKTTLGINEYFVLGDNRQNSKDSRSIGTIPLKNIEGRVFLILYPFKYTQFISHYSYQANALSNNQL